MAKTQGCIASEREKRHLDTRARHHECERPDPNRGLDPGLDVAGGFKAALR